MSLIIPIFILFIVPIALSAEITPFSMPESSYYTLHEFITNTGNELSIAAYTFTSDDIAQLLLNVMQNEVKVNILIEKSPVGGMSLQQKEILCSLHNKGATIYLYNKTRPREYHHAKYMISDKEQVLVSTDNFVSTSYPSTPFEEYSRGWGVIVYDKSISNEFYEIFNFDMTTAIPFICESVTPTPTTTTILLNRKLTRKNAEVETLFVPNNAKEKIIQIMNSTKNILYIEQLYIYKNWGNDINPFLQITIEKARQGVDTRILLDGRYYSIPKNNETLQYLESLNISTLQVMIEYSTPLHVKGIISDDTVIISSVNWNQNSATNNREAGVIIKGGISEYYKNLFLSDWDPRFSQSLATAQATEMSDYSRELIFISIGIVVVLVFLLKNNVFS